MLSMEDSAWYDGLHPSEQERLGLRLKRVHDTGSSDEFIAEIAALFAARGDTLNSHQSDSVVAHLRTVKVRLTQRKPHDDFCGLLPIGCAPQIKLGNDAVESL